MIPAFFIQFSKVSGVNSRLALLRAGRRDIDPSVLKRTVLATDLAIPKTNSLLLYIFGRLVLLFAHSCFNKAYLVRAVVPCTALPATHRSIQIDNAFLREFLPERK